MMPVLMSLPLWESSPIYGLLRLTKNTPLIDCSVTSNPVDSVLDISFQKNQRFPQLTSNARRKSQGLMGSIESWAILWLCGRMCGVKADNQEGRISKMRRK